MRFAQFLSIIRWAYANEMRDASFSEGIAASCGVFVVKFYSEES